MPGFLDPPQQQIRHISLWHPSDETRKCFHFPKVRRITLTSRENGDGKILKRKHLDNRTTMPTLLIHFPSSIHKHIFCSLWLPQKGLSYSLWHFFYFTWERAEPLLQFPNMYYEQKYIVGESNLASLCKYQRRLYYIRKGKKGLVIWRSIKNRKRMFPLLFKSVFKLFTWHFDSSQFKFFHSS